MKQWQPLLLRQRCFRLLEFESVHTDSCIPIVERVLSFCRSGAIVQAVVALNSLDSNSIANKPLVYGSLLQTSAKAQSLLCGIQLHAQVVKSGLVADRFVGNTLLSLYFKLAKNGDDTRRVFEGLLHKDAVSWSSMVSCYIKEGRPGDAVELFLHMLATGRETNGFSLSAAIKGCADEGNLRAGRSIHTQVVLRGFESNLVVSCSLICFYGKNSCVDDARRVFDEMSEPDSISWTAIISAYTKNEAYDKALLFFLISLRKGVCLLDDFTYGTVLTACGNLGRSWQGRELHAKTVVSGFIGNVFVDSSLVDMYGKMGWPNDSRRIFDRMSSRNAVTWSALLDGYCQNGDFESAIRVVRDLNELDLYSFGSIIRVCAALAALKSGKEVHAQYLKLRRKPDVIIESALVDLYAKCGSVDFSCKVFRHMSTRNLISWNAMINGFAVNGRPHDALRLFKTLIRKDDDVTPDHITFLEVIYACNHAGLVEEGRNAFFSMTKDYKITPRVEHYNCIVDLLGRAGLHDEAERVIMEGDYRGEISLWNILLGACAGGGNPEVAERIAKKMMEVEPRHHGSYIYLTNLYKAVGRWEDATRVRTLMQTRGVQKISAKSWI